MPHRLNRSPRPKMDEMISSATIFEDRKRWTRAECDDLERYGFLPERYELIDGEILLKMPQKQPHAIAVSRLLFYLMGIFGPDRVQTQTTAEIAATDRPTNRPEPDVTVLSRPADEYTGTPSIAETSLVAEISDTTLRGDLAAKAALYARAGGTEYWVIDVPGRRAIIHRDPQDGIYQSVTTHRETEKIAPLCAATSEIEVARLLPPAKMTRAAKTAKK